MWLQTGYGLVIGFTELIQNVITSNYGAIANCLNLQFTTARNKALSLLSLLCLQSFSGNGFQQRSLFSFRFHALTARRLSPNQLNSRLVLLRTPRHAPHRKHRLQQLFYCFTQLSNGPRRESLFPVNPLVRVRNLLSSNGRYLRRVIT
jgi:hypothetical protein